MKYESQRVAWWFFATCMLLFSLQIVYGFIMGFAHAGYDGLHECHPVQRRPRDAHQPAGDVAALRLHGRGVLHHPRGGRARADCGRSSASCSWARSSSSASSPSSASTSTGGRAASSSRSRAARLPRRGRRAGLHLQHRHDHLERQAYHHHQHGAVLRSLAAALLYLPGMIISTQSDPRLLLPLVGGAPLGRGRVGAHHGRDPLVPAHQAHGRRPRGDREVALRHRGLHVPVRHPRHGPPLLLHRHARSTGSWIGGIFSALEPLAFLGMAIYAIAMAEGRPQAPQPHRAQPGPSAARS
jgi:hypothetical protein